MSTLPLNNDQVLDKLILEMKKLSPEAKLKLSEAIWSEDMVIPQSHQDIVEKRMKQSKLNPERMKEWDKIKDNFKFNMKTIQQFTAIIEREGDGYISLCPELDIASQGDTVEQAKSNLTEALELFFECADPIEIQNRTKAE